MYVCCLCLCVCHVTFFDYSIIYTYCCFNSNLWNHIKIRSGNIESHFHRLQLVCSCVHVGSVHVSYAEDPVNLGMLPKPTQNGWGGSDDRSKAKVATPRIIIISQHTYTTVIHGLRQKMCEYHRIVHTKIRIKSCFRRGNERVLDECAMVRWFTLRKWESCRLSWHCQFGIARGLHIICPRAC